MKNPFIGMIGALQRSRQDGAEEGTKTSANEPIVRLSSSQLACVVGGGVDADGPKGTWGMPTLAAV